MDIHTLLTAIIAFGAVFTALGLLFRVLLGPVYREIQQLKAGQDLLNTKIDKILNKP